MPHAFERERKEEEKAEKEEGKEGKERKREKEKRRGSLTMVIVSKAACCITRLIK